MKSMASRGARLVALLVVVSLVATCGLPRSGPNRRELFAGSVQREGDAFVVSVNDRVLRATAVVEALGFSSDFVNAGQLGSDTIRPGDTLSLSIWENVTDPLLGAQGAPSTQLDDVQVDGAGFIFVPYAGRVRAAGNTPDQLRQILTRAGRLFLAAEIEDLTGSVEVTVWPDTYDQTRDLWAEGNIVILNVRIRTRNDRLQLSVQKATAYQEGRNPGPDGGNSHAEQRAARKRAAARRALRLTLKETADTEGDQERLRAVMSALEEFEGEDEVRLAIRQQDGDEVELELPRARACDELSQRLSAALGDQGAVML